MMKRLLLLCLLSLPSTLLGQENVDVEAVRDPNALGNIVKQIEELATGGIRKFSFKSELDGSFQPLLMKIPPGYTTDKSWPLLVVLHGLGDVPIVVPSINSMIQIGPFGRGDLWYRGLGEKDVLECVYLAKKLFNVDPERIYLCGFSMGGAGTFELGLKHPDIWAACVPVCGALGDMELVENGGNLPFWIHTGGLDDVLPAEQSHAAYQKAVSLGFEHWKYTEHEEMGHSFHVDWSQVEKWLLNQRRVQRPAKIHFCSSEPAKAYWLEIQGKLQDEISAKITLHVGEQLISITTANVSDYILHLHSAPIEPSKEVVVMENGKEVFRDLPPEGGILRRTCRENSLDRVAESDV
jgi:pimeloyl-ACP methyl ester carboxylesterase